MEDADSTPDTDIANDQFVDTDDVTIDNRPGDEDDHDRAALDPAEVKRQNSKLPDTGSDALQLVWMAAAMVAAGAAVSLLVRRRRRA